MIKLLTTKRFNRGVFAAVLGAALVCVSAFADSDPDSRMSNSRRESHFVLAAGPGIVTGKNDKVVRDCVFAKINDVSIDYPSMTAIGKYAKNYEEAQKLKPVKVEVVRNPRYGVLFPYATHIEDGKEVPSDLHFGMKSTDPNYIGPDLAEYAVELKNGKRVLVRTHIYWVNIDSDFISKCPPSKFEMQEMREIQKRKSASGGA